MSTCATQFSLRPKARFRAKEFCYAQRRSNRRRALIDISDGALNGHPINRSHEKFLNAYGHSEDFAYRANIERSYMGGVLTDLRPVLIARSNL
jgi:hypothetical protein